MLRVTVRLAVLVMTALGGDCDRPPPGHYRPGLVQAEIRANGVARDGPRTGRARGAGALHRPHAELTRTSTVSAANRIVTYVMLNVNTRMLAAGVGMRDRANVAKRNPNPRTAAVDV